MGEQQALPEDPGSIPGLVIPPTRQGGCQVPRWGDGILKRFSHRQKRGSNPPLRHCWADN